jgi:hypothetical protein
MAIENLKKGQINFLFSLFDYNIYIYIYITSQKREAIGPGLNASFFVVEKKEVIIIINNNIIIISILFIFITQEVTDIAAYN